jgi:hypothetical protein
MSDNSEPAFPQQTVITTEGVTYLPKGGLTKREYFAGQILQGMLSIPPSTHSQEWTVSEYAAGAVVWADALLTALQSSEK